MRNIAHHDHRQQPARMKLLRIIFGCPAGARKWRILSFAMLLNRKNQPHAPLREGVRLVWLVQLAAANCSFIFLLVRNKAVKWAAVVRTQLMR